MSGLAAQLCFSGPLFCLGLLDRSGLARYTHVMRSANDPSETMARGGAARAPGWNKRLGTADGWCVHIVEHMRDGRARTFNRICVELVGTTADVLFEEAPDQGLWLAVKRELLGWTVDAPVLFLHRDALAADAVAA